MIAPASIYTPENRPKLSGLSSASLFNSSILPVVNRLSGSFDDAQVTADQEFRAANTPAPQGIPIQESYERPTDDLLGPPPVSQRAAVQPVAPNPDPLNPMNPEIDPTQPLGARNLGDANAGDLVSFVKGFEGFNQNAYDDYGQTSIGYGTRARPGESSISEQDAQARLQEELATHRKRVEDLNAKAGYNLSPNQLDALTSFDYNTGRLEQLTANGTRDIATIGQKIPLYNKAGGKPLAGLTRRRKDEAYLFMNGYPTQ